MALTIYLIGVICSVLCAIITGMKFKENKIDFWMILAGLISSLLSWCSVAVYIVLIYFKQLNNLDNWIKIK